MAKMAPLLEMKGIISLEEDIAKGPGNERERERERDSAKGIVVVTFDIPG